MTSVEVFSLLLLAAGFLLLQVLHIWPLWIKLGLEGWHSVCSFLPMSNSAGEYPRDKGVERFVSMGFSFFCMFITVWTAHSISLFDCICDCLGLFQIPIPWQTVCSQHCQNAVPCQIKLSQGCRVLRILFKEL